MRHISWPDTEAYGGVAGSRSRGPFPLRTIVADPRQEFLDDLRAARDADFLWEDGVGKCAYANGVNGAAGRGLGLQLEAGSERGRA